MSWEGIVIGILAIAIGGAFAFYGLQLFVILLPIWLFFVGLIGGASWAQTFLSEGFFGTATSWIIGLVVGIVLAAISYFFYYGAVALLGAAVGYTLGAGLMVAIGVTGFLSVVVGLIVAALVGLAVIVLAVPIWLVILLSAGGGAAAVVNGAWILLGRIQLEDISGGLGQGLMKDGFFSVAVWIVIAIAGFLYQIRVIGRASMMASADISKEGYRY